MNLSLLFLFGIVFFSSLIGSLQLGPVNGAVIKAALHSRSQALWIAFGGVLPEAIYSGIAYYILSFLHLSPFQSYSLQLIGASVITLIGVGFVYQASSNHEHVHLHPLARKAGVFYGFMYGIGNMQLIVFWLSVLGYSSTAVHIGHHQLAQVSTIMLASTLGAFATLCIFTFLVTHNKERILKYIAPHYINMGIGALLVCLGLYQLVMLLW